MAVAYPWHMLLFHEQYVAIVAFTRGEPIMLLGMATIFFQAVVFVCFYPLYLRHRPAGNVIRQGVEFSLFMVFATAAKFAIEPVLRFLIYGTVFQFPQFLAVGIVLGLIYRPTWSAQ